MSEQYPFSSNTQRARLHWLRRTTLTLPDGSSRSGWFALNFTWAEVSTLAAHQALPFRDQSTTASRRWAQALHQRVGMKRLHGMNLLCAG